MRIYLLGFSSFQKLPALGPLPLPPKPAMQVRSISYDIIHFVAIFKCLYWTLLFCLFLLVLSTLMITLGLPGKSKIIPPV